MIIFLFYQKLIGSNKAFAEIWKPNNSKRIWTMEKR